MDEKKIIQYNQFIKLCLANAEGALDAAGLLKQRNIKHIAYHLCVLTLEEIGKIIVGYYELEGKEITGKSKSGIDDHVKKLFWAIWGPYIGQEKITKEQFDINNKMALAFHKRRLDVLYTDISDSILASEKITDEELTMIFDFATARLNLAKIDEGDFISNKSDTGLTWFMEATNDIEKRGFIFGESGQNKLIELGDIKVWIDWLEQHFKKEELDLREIALKEINRSVSDDESLIKDKWKMKFKVISPSHSIRQNSLEGFNSKNKRIKLNKGGDNRTLFIEVVFGDNISINNLWNESLLYSKLFVTALNVATNGFFYWNVETDVEKFYETLTDAETNRRLEIRAVPALKLNWDTKKMVLEENNLHLTTIVFRFLSNPNNPSIAPYISIYMNALAMMAKSDIHLRFEINIFLLFHDCFIKLLELHRKNESEENITDFGFSQIGSFTKDRDAYERNLSLADTMNATDNSATARITLSEVISMKQYCGAYILTLAARQFYNSEDVFIMGEL